MSTGSSPGAEERPIHLEAEIAAEVGQETQSVRELVKDTFGLFARWCAVNALTAMPASELTVLRYLHSRYGDITAGTAQAAVRGIQLAHRAEGEPIPTGVNLRRYLRLLGRDGALPEEQPKVDALRTDDARLIATSMVNRPPSPVTVELRAWIAAAAAAGTSLRRVAGLTAADMAVSDTHIRLLLPAKGGNEGRAVTIDFVADPHRAAALVAWRDAAEPSQTLGDGATAARLKGTFRRAGLEFVGMAGPVDLPLQAESWLLANAEPDLHRQLRDRAYMLVGLFTALRHDSMANLVIRDCIPSGLDYSLDVRQVKGNQDGLVKTLPCAARPGTTCTAPFCPACALRAWLYCLEWSHKRTTGPVFCTYYGKRWQAMTRQNARVRLHQMWTRSGLEPGARISTRSLRSGAITSAVEAGFELWQVAQETSDHKTLSVCRVYVRRRDAWTWDYQLEP